MDARHLERLLVVGLLLWVSGAAAEVQLPGASLVVRNPPSSPRCVDESALAARVHAQLSGRASVERGQIPLTLDVQIQRTSSAMLAELHVSGRAPGSRKIEAARCEGLTEALAVTVAMVLDQDARDSAAEAQLQTAPGTAQPKPSEISAGPIASQTAAQGSGNPNQPAPNGNAAANGTAAAPATSASPLASEGAAHTSTKVSAAANAPAAVANATNASIPAPKAAPEPASRPATVPPTPTSQGPSTAPSARIDLPSSTAAQPAADAASEDIRAWFGAGAGSSNRWHFEIGGEYGVQRWALQMGAFFQPIHQRMLGWGTLEILSAGGLLAGCRRFGTDLRFAPCVRASFGWERVDSQGFDQKRIHNLAVATLGPSVGIETGHRWVLGLDLIGEFGLTPRTYQVENYVENRTKSVESPLFVLWLVARVALSSGT